MHMLESYTAINNNVLRKIEILEGCLLYYVFKVLMLVYVYGPVCVCVCVCILMHVCVYMCLSLYRHTYICI